MKEEFTLNNIESDDTTINDEENDYKKLITTLQDMSSTIALLEKIIFR